MDEKEIINSGEEEEYDITEEVDRQEIYRQIEERIKSRRIGGEKAPEEAGKRGASLPLAVNVGSIFILILGVLAFYWMSQRGSYLLLIKSETPDAFDAKVFQEVQRRAREEIEAQKKKLVAIEEKISAMERERDDWIRRQNESLREKEEEIGRRYRDALAEEIEKIRGEGGNVEARIAEAKAQSEKKISEAISQIRAEASQEISEYQRKIESELYRLEQEKSSYQVAISNVQAKLESERARADTAQRKIGELEENARALLEHQENGRAFRLQVDSLYARAISAYQMGDYEGAKRNFSRMSEQLSRAPTLNIDEATKDSARTLALMANTAASLVDLVERVNAAKSDAEIQRLKDAHQEINRLFEEANSLYRGGEYEASRQKYRMAIDVIDRISNSYEKISEIEKKLASKRAKEEIARAENLLERGDYQGAESAYESAIRIYPENSLIKAAMDGLRRVRALAAAEAEAKHKEEMKELVARFEREIEERKRSANEKALSKLGEARLLESSNRHLEAKQKYESIFVEAPESDYLREALDGINRTNEALALEGLENKHLAEKALANTKAQILVSGARELERNGKLEEARRRYGDTLLSAPDSDYTEEALEGLKRISATLASMEINRRLADKRTSSEAAAKAILREAEDLESQGDYKTAREKYRSIILSHPDTPYVNDALAGLSRVEEKMIPPPKPEIVYVQTEPEKIYIPVPRPIFIPLRIPVIQKVEKGEEVAAVPKNSTKAPKSPETEVEVEKHPEEAEDIKTEEQAVKAGTETAKEQEEIALKAEEQEITSPRRIIQIAGNTVYFNTRRVDKVREGMEFTVYRRIGRGLIPIGTVKVIYTSGNIAQANIISAQVNLEVGDIIEL
ncbi:MAG: tetratricopeptide repeat protein [bacterium]